MTEESSSQAEIAWEIMNRIQCKQKRAQKNTFSSPLPNVPPTTAKNLLSLCPNMQAAVLSRLILEA